MGLEKTSFWETELKYAHSRHDLQDQLRFSTVRLFFQFYGIILAALVFKKITAVASDTGLPIEIPLGIVTGVFSIGIMLFWSFTVRDRYVTVYKTWIWVLEAKLMADAQLPRKYEPEKLSEHGGSLYCDDNPPKKIRGDIFSQYAMCMWLLNSGIPIVTLFALGVSPDILTIAIWFFISAVLHVRSIWRVREKSLTRQSSLTQNRRRSYLSLAILCS